MKINELIAELKAMLVEDFDRSKTVDNIKVGNGDDEIKKLAVAMFATPEIIKKASEYGANFLIVHEPTFYNHPDNQMPFALCHEKKALIEKCGLTVFRFHDYAHRMSPDLIFEGQIKYSGLKYRHDSHPAFGVNRIVLDEAMTPVELAKTLEENLGVRHLRIAGSRDNPVKTIGCCFGTPGHLAEEIEACDAVLTGEITEWSIGEYLRDLAQLGYRKSMIVMGHVNSEKYGMKLLCEKLTALHPELECEYFDCGDVYSYTD